MQLSLDASLGRLMTANGGIGSSTARFTPPMPAQNNDELRKAADGPIERLQAKPGVHFPGTHTSAYDFWWLQNRVVPAHPNALRRT